MPPRAPQRAADALDVALSAPSKTPAATSFFEALKPQNPAFAQTTRVNVARPKAQLAQQATVVPPPRKPAAKPKVTQAEADRELARYTPHATPVTTIAKDAVSAAAHPVRTYKRAQSAFPGGDITVGQALGKANEATNAGLAKVARASAGPDLSGEASTNAGLLNAARGVPLATMTAAHQASLRSAVAFFAAHPTYHYDVPDLGLYDAAAKAKVGLPPTATDSDVFRKAYAPYVGQRNGFETFLHNVPQGALQFAASPVGLAYVTSQSLTGHPEAGREALREQVDFGKQAIEHPLGTLEQQPVPFITALLGAARGAGGLAGTVARTGVAGERAAAFLTPAEREVRPAGYQDTVVKPGAKAETIGKVVSRGQTSPKLDERLAQAASDALAEHSKVFGSRLVKKDALATQKAENRTTMQLEREHVEPMARAAAKLNRNEIRAVTAYHGQGFHDLDEAVTFFQKGADEHRTLEQAAKNEGEAQHAEWQIRQRDADTKAKEAAGLRKKLGNAPTDEMQHVLDLMGKTTRAGEQIMQAQRRHGSPVPILGEDTALRRAYGPRAQIGARVTGDEASQRMLDLTNERNDLADALKRASPTKRSALQKRLAAAQAAVSDAQEARLGSVKKRVDALQGVADEQGKVTQTPALDTAEKIINRQGAAPRPEAARLEAMQGRAAEAFPVGDRIRPSELDAADKHLRLLERKMRAAQSPATKRRLQAKIDEFTPIRDRMAAAPVGPEVRQLRAQAARAGVEQRAFGAAEKAAAPVLPKALRADEAQRARLTRPVAKKLARLQAERDRLEAGLKLPSDVSTATTRNLSERIAKTPTPDTIKDQIEQVRLEQERAIHDVRTDYRARKGAPAVEHNAPLDEHDPLFFQHVLEGPSALARVLRRGQSGHMTSENVAAPYDNRLGRKGRQSNSQLFAEGRSTSDPRVYFGGAAKPFKVEAALRSLRAHVLDGIRTVPAGTRYDRAKWVRLRGTPGAKGPDAVHVTEEADEAVREATHEGARQKILDAFEGADQKSGYGSIPDDGQEYHLVSRHAFDLIDRQTKGLDSGTLAALRKLTGIWRWATLVARPAWLVSNAVGNPIQALTSGAGVAAHVRALRTGEGQKYEGVGRDVENTGLYRNTFERSSGPAGHLMRPVHAFSNVVIDLNNRLENYERRAVKISSLTADAKAQVHGEVRTLRSNVHVVNSAVHDAIMHPTPEANARAVRHVDDYLNDYTRVQRRSSGALDIISPFHRWFAFITKLVVKMPVKTPGRALLIERLGQLGINVQNQQTGGFTPDSKVGAIQLPSWLGGGLKSTQSWNPYATPFQLLDLADNSTTDPGQIGYGGISGATNPLLGQLPFEFATGKSLPFNFQDLKDASGNPVGPFNPRVALHDAETSIPFATMLEGYNTPATAVNPFSPGDTKAGALSQPRQSILDRLAGYGVGGVGPFDARKNQAASLSRLKVAEKAKAVNIAKARERG